MGRMLAWAVAVIVGLVLAGMLAIAIVKALFGMVAYILVGAVVVAGGMYLYARARRAIGPGTRTRLRIDAARQTFRMRNR